MAIKINAVLKDVNQYNSTDPEVSLSFKLVSVNNDSDTVDFGPYDFSDTSLSATVKDDIKQWVTANWGITFSLGDSVRILGGLVDI